MADSHCPLSQGQESSRRGRHGAINLFPWLGVLVRCVLAIPATSAAPERFVFHGGDVVTKKRSHLTCDNMEKLVYLHELLPQVREWEAVKKMCLA